ncbi:hypothetical protein GH714_033948 [Hevea brasiliensis]|uniref:Uncharacterized protein n=1 Tax=Hevea brasiliensis TaxID=3981 RepID=A0A6A6LQ69_HEVBR|nr:hypothetical protein GH714_033948 [Hevea brasiliensis]
MGLSERDLLERVVITFDEFNCFVLWVDMPLTVKPPATITLDKGGGGEVEGFAIKFETPIDGFPKAKEMEEREKVVKHMWDVYTNSRRIRLPRFWQEAFEAAYEELTSDVPGIRDAAISEIAKMSVRSVVLDPPPFQSTVSIAFQGCYKLFAFGM